MCLHVGLVGRHNKDANLPIYKSYSFELQLHDNCQPTSDSRTSAKYETYLLNGCPLLPGQCCKGRDVISHLQGVTLDLTVEKKTARRA